MASGSSARGRAWRRGRSRPSAGRELTVEQLRTLGVERGERLVEDEQRRLVQERAAEREALQHPARERARPLVPRLPETEALEHHPDALAPLGHAVQPAVEVEVLERAQLAVDERLVPEEAEVGALRSDLESPLVGRISPATRRSSVVLPEPFGPVTSTKPPRSISKLSSSMTRFAPNRFARPRARIIMRRV